MCVHANVWKSVQLLGFVQARFYRSRTPYHLELAHRSSPRGISIGTRHGELKHDILPCQLLVDSAICVQLVLDRVAILGVKVHLHKLHAVSSCLISSRPVTSVDSITPFSPERACVPSRAWLSHQAETDQPIPTRQQTNRSVHSSKHKVTVVKSCIHMPWEGKPSVAQHYCGIS